MIPFTERIKGEASIEFFNLLNRPNVEDIDHVYGLADFARGQSDTLRRPCHKSRESYLWSAEIRGAGARDPAFVPDYVLVHTARGRFVPLPT